MKTVECYIKMYQEKRDKLSEERMGTQTLNTFQMLQILTDCGNEAMKFVAAQMLEDSQKDRDNIWQGTLAEEYPDPEPYESEDFHN
jgi:hypothetical protein